MKINNIVCIDFETGGLKCMKTPITQVAAIGFRADTFEELYKYTTYVKGYDKTPQNALEGQPTNLFDKAPTCNPEKQSAGLLQDYVGYDNLRYDQKALDFTKVTKELLESDGLLIEEVVNDLAVLFKSTNTAGSITKKPVLLGHNIPFDIGFLQYMFKFCKVDLSKLLHGTEDAFGNFTPAYYDTMWLSRMKWVGDPNMTKYNLSACCIKAGNELVDAHDAMADIRGTIELYKHLVGAIRGEAKKEDGVKMFRTRNKFEF